MSEVGDRSANMRDHTVHIGIAAIGSAVSPAFIGKKMRSKDFCVVLMA
jgi:hypothetical protein